MRKKFFLPSIVLSIAALSVGFFAPAKAVVPPSIEGGFYQVRNLTKGGDYAKSVAAAKCDELQYRIRIHNPGPDEPLKNVSVKVNFPATVAATHTSSATVSASNAVPSSVSDSATVNLSTAQKVTIVAGSAQLLDVNGNVIRGLGDVTAGVNIGDVGISLNQRKYVTFKAKVDCPQPPVPETPKPETPKPETPKPQPPVTQNQTQSQSQSQSVNVQQSQTAAPAPAGTAVVASGVGATPEVLPAAGPTDVAAFTGIVGLISSIGSYYYSYFLRRLNRE